jgi:hypothetical protein
VVRRVAVVVLLEKPCPAASVFSARVASRSLWLAG